MIRPGVSPQERARGGLEETTDKSQVLDGLYGGHETMQEDSRTPGERKAVRQVPESSMSREGQKSVYSHEEGRKAA